MRTHSKVFALPNWLSSPVVILFFAIFFLMKGMEVASSYQHFSHVPFSFLSTSSLVYFLGYTWTYFVALPSVVAVVLLQEKLSNLGVRLPESNGKGWMLIIIAWPLCLACLVWLSHFSSFQHYYGVLRQAPLMHFLGVQCFVLPLYYCAEEYFFRGFLFLTLWKKIGWHSLWITELLFTIAHITKPGAEIAFAIPVGIVLNLAVLWTRSIVPAIVMHGSLGVLLNFLIYFR